MSSPNMSQLRRMSSPVPPPAPLDLPELPSPRNVVHPNPSRSPLRNGITLDPATGTFSEDGSPDDDDTDPWGIRDRDLNHSPSPSITKFASSFVQRVGSLVSSVSPGSQTTYLPSEAELEAEAESQREKSRREAERILTQEANERKKVEERVLEMLEASRTRPIRSQTVPSPVAPPSPTPSNKESSGGWWSAAKNKLTPTKDKELTPAQQIVLDTKAREKEKRKGKDKEWPADPGSKYQDPTFQSLSLPPGARPMGGLVGGGANVISGSPVSPSPQPRQQPRQLAGSPTPSPSRSPAQSSIDLQGRIPGASPAHSTSSREPPPIYAQFTNQGTLDIPATLLTVARRFEKLERWTVGHVRALEERMSDVEKWLVDKEREREQREQDETTSKLSSNTDPTARDSEKGTPSAPHVVREVTIERKTVEVDQGVKREVGEIKEELGELRGRVGELGREVTRLASASSNDISHPVSPSEASGFGIGRIASPVSTGPNTPAFKTPRTLPSTPLQQILDRPQSPSAQSIARSETASIISTGTATRTKLPYPTGDYTSPSPPGSPRPSVTTSQNIGNYTANNASSNISRTRPISISGLPIPQTNFKSSVGIPHATDSASSSPSLPAPPGLRHVSISPTPRKRYTVALGQPLSSSPSTSSLAAAAASVHDSPLHSIDEPRGDFGEGLFSEPAKVELKTAFFTQATGESDGEDEYREPARGGEAGDNDNEKGGADIRRQETIGKTPITLSRLSISPPPSQNSSPSHPGRAAQRNSPRASPSNPRVRAQSTYGVPGSSASSVTSLTRQERTYGHGSISPSSSGGDDKKGSWRTRSRSIDRIGLGIDMGRPQSKFVDPLVVRKKEKESVGVRPLAVGSPGARGRVAFGDLLAFFDAEKQ